MSQRHHFSVALAVITLLVFLPSIAAAYTSKTTATGEIVRWPSRKITMKLGAEVLRRIGRDDARSAARMASEAWRGLDRVPDIEIDDDEALPANAPQRAHNGIYMLDEWPHGDHVHAVTVSTYRMDGEILRADIYLNGTREFAVLQEPAQGPGDGRYDMVGVLTHEMGHVLGLDESFDDEHATMWPYIAAGEVHQRSLAADDEDGVVGVYAEPWNTASCSVNGTPHPERADGVLFAGLGLLVGWRLRQRQRTSERMARSHCRRVLGALAVLGVMAPSTALGQHAAVEVLQVRQVRERTVVPGRLVQVEVRQASASEPSAKVTDAPLRVVRAPTAAPSTLASRRPSAEDVEAIHHCYELAQRTDGALRGPVEVRVSVDHTGAPRLQVRNRNLGKLHFIRCLKREFGRVPVLESLPPVTQSEQRIVLGESP